MVWMMNFQDEQDEIDKGEPENCVRCGTPIDNDTGLCVDCREMGKLEPCQNCRVLIDLGHEGHMRDPEKGLLCLDCALWFNEGQKPSKTPWVAEPEEASDGRRIAICSPAGDAIVAVIPPEDLPADARDWTEAAALIRAVNSHEDLVKALEHAVAMIEASIDRYGDPAKLFDLEHYREVLQEAEAQAWENCLKYAPQRILKLLGLADKKENPSEGDET